MPAPTEQMVTDSIKVRELAAQIVARPLESGQLPGGMAEGRPGGAVVR